MVDGWSAHVGIYRVLDDVLGSGVVPPGAKGAIFAIIDRLRGGALNDELTKAEQISVDLHRLETALQQRDPLAADAAKHSLKAHAASWLQGRISSPAKSSFRRISAPVVPKSRQIEYCFGGIRI